MFTGIVEEVGTIDTISRGANSAVLTIRAEKVLAGTKVGDSIAVNGICLTVTRLMPHAFTADVMHETLNRSSFANAMRGAHVNLERAMAADGRFGGHIVSGHVDGTGRIVEVKKDDNAIWYTIQAAPQLMRYIVEKGSVTIDGISLTVAKVAEDNFSISAIPHTVSQTVLKDRKVGAVVNLETDIIGKYVEKLLFKGQSEGITEEMTGAQTNKENVPHKSGKNKKQPVGITRDFLAKYGFLHKSTGVVGGWKSAGAEWLKNYVIEQLQNHKRKDIKYEIQHSRRST